MKKDYETRVENAYNSCFAYFKNQSQPKPTTALILGSGLSGIANAIDGVEIPFSQVDGFPVSTVKGHGGFLKISDKCAVMAGRVHYYEGYSIEDVVLPIFLLGRLGIKNLIITNAAGAINKDLSPGDLALINDHINLTGTNPLIGANNDNLGPRFPDMSCAYNLQLREKALSINKNLKSGVYAGLSGPFYETPAEVRMLKIIGADLVGMSTVNEVNAARYLGINVLGISCVTNMAAGISDKPLDHSEVIKVGKSVEKELSTLVLSLLKNVISYCSPD